MNFEHENIRSDVEHNNDVDNKLRAVSPSSASIEPLALMDCGEFSLLISSKDIMTLMSVQKITASKATHTCGSIEFEQQSIPVFAFNKALQLQPSLPSAQMTLVIIQHQSWLFALCCFALEKIELADMHFYTVPLNMSSRKQPFAQFAVINKRAAGLTSAAELWRLLEMRKAVHPVPAIQTHELIQGAG
jgi:hypothetical protein